MNVVKESGKPHALLGHDEISDASLTGRDMDIPALSSLLVRHGIEAVVFDLDGTLVHSAVDLIEAVRRSFVHHQLGELPADYLPAILNGTMEGVMADACSSQGWPVPGDFAPIKQDFARIYTEMDYPNVHLFPEVRRTLVALSQTGVKLAVCTNSNSGNANQLLKKLGVLDLLHFVCGADTFGAHKPSPVPLERTLAQLGTTAQHALYVGDTDVDALCACNADIRFAWFQGGYGGTAPEAYPYRFKFALWSELGKLLSDTRDQSVHV